MVHSVMVFYGFARALIAVNVFEIYADVSKIISQEATALAVLYRDVSTYPEPIRPQLQKQVRDYVEYIIHEAWPLQQRGRGSERWRRCCGRRFAGRDVDRDLGGRVHQPECLLLFQGRGCALARDLGDTSGDILRDGHIHDPRSRPSVPGRSGSTTRTLSTHLRPSDETIVGDKAITDKSNLFYRVKSRSHQQFSVVTVAKSPFHSLTSKKADRRRKLV